MTEDIKVLIVDESPRLTQSLLLGLRLRGSVSVLGPVPDAPAALDAMESGFVHLVLVDLDREDGTGVETVRQIREGDGSTRVLGVTSDRTPDLAAGALAAGACGVVAPEHDGNTLLSAFRRALAGELVLPAVHLSNLVDRLRGSNELSDGARIASLTTRETQILRALADGSATGEIARALGISPMTVQSHVKNILSKLGVHTKVEAVTLAWRFGMGTASRTA